MSVRTIPFAILGLLVLSAPATGGISPPTGWHEPPAVVPPAARVAADSVNAFAVDLYRRLAGEPGNVFFSPVSLQVALGLLSAGARGRTAAELATACHWSGDPVAARDGLRDLHASLQPRDPSRAYWEATCRLWGQAGLTLRPSFAETVTRWPGGSYGTVDFRAEGAAVRRTIDAWVAEQTHGLVRNVLPDDAVNEQTGLVVTSAVYFLSHWKVSFPLHRTRNQPFHLSSENTVTVPMMAVTSHLPYVEYRIAGHEGQVLELPYRDPDFAMVVFLPAARDGLPELERTLTAGHVRYWLDKLRRTSVRCRLPRFAMSRNISLRRALVAMGLTTTFTDRADFGGITGERDLFLHDVIHGAFLRVYEQGTEAGAATHDLWTYGIEHVMGERQVTFRADHPFLLLIRHRPTGAILFMGRLVDPRG